MTFKADHPDYKSYQSDTYIVDHIPPNVFDGLQGLLLNAATQSYTRDAYIKNAINILAQNIPCEAGQAWSGSFLTEELNNYTTRISEAKFHRQMDYFQSIAKDPYINYEMLIELFEDNNFGFKLDFNELQGHYWTLLPEVNCNVQQIEETIETIKDICDQTSDHLIQAKEQLSGVLTDRDLKDAVRDCLSAMETMLKKITDKSDIKDATKVLRSELSVWGKDDVVKEGLSIWNRMHTIYPDMRHGNPHQSELTLEEAIYWVERITSYVRYITKVYIKTL